MSKRTTIIEDVPDKKGKKQKNRRGAKIAILGAAFGLCASAIAALSVALYFEVRAVDTHETYQRQMDAVYYKAYYDLIDGADDLGVKLRKLSASSSPTMQQALLYEVWSAASLAENSLGMFDSQSDGLLKAQKFINQLGDYAHTLALRVSDGSPLTADERNRLKKLADVAEVYKSSLTTVGDGLDDSGAFVGDNGALQSFASAFDDFAQPTFDYPEMIYDGPFSDSLEKRSPALKLPDITNDKAAELLEKYFSGHDIADISYEGEGGGNLPTYNFGFSLNGVNAFAQVAKGGGALIAFNAAYAPVNAKKASSASDIYPACQQKAKAFCDKLGYDDMTVVWTSEADGECTINLAPKQNGVLLYPDLVKVKFSSDGERLLAFDATHYAYNHRARSLPSPAIAADSAKSKLAIPPASDAKLALIPLREAKEVLAYEFECHSDGTYFVYIDALTGDEANILYVIDSDAAGMRTM